VRNLINQGIRTFIHPVKDAQRSSTLFCQLLGVDPHVEQPYYVAFRLGDQGIGLDPNGHKAGLAGPVGYGHEPDINAALQSLLAAGTLLLQQVKDVGDGKLIALVKDQDGNIIGLIQPS
jgi:predicted enzyme related to lactoylglutathione lyase